MKFLPIRLPTLLLAFNWIVFIAVFAWTSVVQHSLSWWLRLDWASALTWFRAMATLGQLPAGSVWILWLLLGAISTVVFAWRAVVRRRTDALSGHLPQRDNADQTGPADEDAQWHLATDDPVVAAHNGLIEKIERLQKSLDRI